MTTRARFSSGPWLALTRQLSFGISVLAMMASACGASPKQVESVARTDLGCAQVSVAEIAKNRYAASGCGRGGVYARLCGGSPESCSWVRLRGAEPPQATTAGGSMAAPPREIIQAPVAAPREIIQAPPPAPRQIIQAPPPASAPPAPPTPSAPPAPTSTAPVDPATEQAYSAQQVPLSQGALSQPYEAEVPPQPIAQQVVYPPPAPLEEQRPPPPAPNYQWVDGYWWWGNPNWLWAPGYWTTPMYGYSYVPGSWYWANNYWWYGPGGWARPNSTYIAFGVGMRPHRQVYTRSFTPYHSMGAYPGRMGALPVHPGYGAHGPGAGFRPQNSPLYHYPSSGTNAFQGERMGGTHVGPYGGANYGGRTNYGGGVGGMQQQGPSRMGSAPVGQPRAAPLTRMPSSSPSFNNPSPMRSAPMERFQGGGGGSGPARMGPGPMHVGPRR